MQLAASPELGVGLSDRRAQCLRTVRGDQIRRFLVPGELRQRGLQRRVL